MKQKHNKIKIKKHHHYIYYGSIISILFMLIFSFIPFFDVIKPETKFINKTIISSYNEPYMVEEINIEYVKIKNISVPIQKKRKYTKFKNITETIIIPEPYQIKIPGKTNIWGLFVYKEIK